SVINALKPRDIKLIEQETDLDQREYNGRLSAVVFMSDLRVGDVVDYSYTIIDNNPVMRGHFATRMFLASDHPIQILRRCVVSPSGRTLYVRSLNTKLEPAVRELGDVREYTWQQHDVPALEFEDATPEWFNPIPGVQIADFETWADVVAWELPLFQLPVSKAGASLSPELENQIRAWRDSSSRPEDQLSAALRFVQDDVRYMAIEIGPYSETPNPPSVVFKRRFGDCKDKSLLLVTVLNRLGIEAYPALVNTESEAAVGAFEPSPFVFDHCIVKAECNGKTYWLDPTRTLQRGTLADASNQDERLALVLKETNRDLEAIPPPSNDQPLISVREVYTVTSYTAPASFEVVTTYRGSAADSERYSLTQTSLPELGKSYLNYYADTDASILVEQPLAVSDDPVSNTLLVKEKYRIPNFWGQKGRYVFGDRISEELNRPRITQRTMPLGVSYPVYIEQTIEVRVPDIPEIASASGTISDDAVHFEYKVGVSGKAAQIKFVYRTVRDSVDVGGVAGHLETLDSIRHALNRHVARGDGSASAEMSDGEALLLLAILATPFLIVGAVVVIKRRQSSHRLRAFAQGKEVRNGDGPERPISIPAAADLPGKLRSLRCRCGSGYRPEEDGSSQERLVYDGRRLIAVTLKCG
ncbi:MAG: DUF3857 domain-containing transglutaminase family protein, partial [Blastocatellia bacterium]